MWPFKVNSSCIRKTLRSLQESNLLGATSRVTPVLGRACELSPVHEDTGHRPVGARCAGWNRMRTARVVRRILLREREPEPGETGPWVPRTC
jgi:hypothetical protein